MRIPNISAYAALKVARGVLWIYTRKGSLTTSVALYLGTIPHLIEALQSAVQLSEGGQDESTAHAPMWFASEQDQGTMILEIPKISDFTYLEVCNGVVCIHDSQGVPDTAVCFDGKDIPALIAALQSVR